MIRVSDELGRNRNQAVQEGGQGDGQGLPDYFRQNIYWPPYKKTLAHISALPTVEAAVDQSVVVHEQMKGVLIFGHLYKFNVWWVAYLKSCAHEGLRTFRKMAQKLTPPSKFVGKLYFIFILYFKLYDLENEKVLGKVDVLCHV